MDSASVFPAPVYRDSVLSPIFEDAKRLFLGAMLDIDYAHVVMLAERGINTPAVTAACLDALDRLDRDALMKTTYDGSVEDLFFLVEKKLAALCGAEFAGRIHTARSRNDMDLTMYRMVLRGNILSLYEASLQLRARLITLAGRYSAAPIPAYTHNQPAQPTTLGHYLMAFIEVFERDADRMRSVWPRLNLSPLGACAITTTGFPIDRPRTAALLAFDGLQVNSYGAIASIDYLTECCAVLVTSMLNIGRLAQEMLLYSTAEFDYLRLSDGYVQTSSIMPQKRNPVPLEHARILASRAMTEAQAVLGCLHNTPFADMNDSEDPLQALVDIAFTDALRAQRLLAGALGEASFNVKHMRERAEGSFLTVTELADTLVRTTGISFHQAHAFVSHAVTACNGVFDRERMVTSVSLSLASARVPVPPRALLLNALDVDNFIRLRSIPGGPAPAALDPEIDRARRQYDTDHAWLAERRLQLSTAATALRHSVDQWKSTPPEAGS
jgi:argininosuccinate lyase